MTQKVDAWLKQYRPFTLGGPVRRNIRCEVEPGGPHDPGRGYLGYLATAPDGTTRVIERTSHAIIGGTLEEVREDIIRGDPAVMAAQTKRGRLDFMTASPVDAGEFRGRAWRES